eukprot:GEMP01058347.1.p1 GENE.GEMP01058347.1~~GEMP01058347.1.p1  ORF type:complete len:114 (+),score=5.40 GEMP01058347.1:96-437(+)
MAAPIPFTLLAIYIIIMTVFSLRLVTRQEASSLPKSASATSEVAQFVLTVCVCFIFIALPIVAMDIANAIYTSQHEVDEQSNSKKMLILLTVSTYASFCLPLVSIFFEIPKSE